MELHWELSRPGEHVHPICAREPMFAKVLPMACAL